MKNNIDIYDELVVYSNSKLLVLLEFSMFLFLIWMFIISIIYLVKKYAVRKVFINKYKEKDFEVIETYNSNIVDSKESNQEDIEEIIDITDISDQDNVEIVNL